MSEQWSDRTVVVTGGRGFLGKAVCARLQQRGVERLVTPGSADYDLRRPDDVARLFAETQPDLVIHLAARVGGIGANMAAPADLYLDNLLMGTYVIEQARLSGTPKTVVTGTICSYPKHTPVPFSEDSLWQGYPEETNAPYGIAKLAQLVQAQANRAQYGQDVIYLMPTNLYGPGDKFHPGVSHVIPALIKKCVEAVESGADHIDVWGTGSASPRVPLRRRRRRGPGAGGRALRRRRPGQPGHRRGAARSATWWVSSPAPPGSRARSGGTRPSPTASPAAASTPAGRPAASGSRPRSPSPRACAARSTGTWPTATRPSPATTEPGPCLPGGGP